MDGKTDAESFNELLISAGATQAIKK
jgi:hypothetical protein